MLPSKSRRILLPGRYRSGTDLIGKASLRAWQVSRIIKAYASRARVWFGGWRRACPFEQLVAVPRKVSKRRLRRFAVGRRSGAPGVGISESSDLAEPRLAGVCRSAFLRRYANHSGLCFFC